MKLSTSFGRGSLAGLKFTVKKPKSLLEPGKRLVHQAQEERNYHERKPQLERETKTKAKYHHHQQKYTTARANSEPPKRASFECVFDSFSGRKREKLANLEETSLLGIKEKCRPPAPKSIFALFRFFFSFFFFLALPIGQRRLCQCLPAANTDSCATRELISRPPCLSERLAYFSASMFASSSKL